jgi:hypothetical protein
MELLSTAIHGSPCNSAPRTLMRAGPVLMLSSLLCACELTPDQPGGRSAPLGKDASDAAPDAFTIVVLPDTQYYSARYPHILDAQTRWVLRERTAARIALVVHEGDIVDEDSPAQWERASRSLHALDGLVPYVLGVGNHDYSTSGAHITRQTLLNRYFPAGGSVSAPGGTFEPGRIENRFDLMPAPGGPWLVLTLEFGPRDAVLRWADGVAGQHAALPAIVVTHGYLAADGARYDHLARPDHAWNPHRYLGSAIPGEVNDGEEIWRKLVSRHDNIHFVLCGHELGPGVSRSTGRRADGSEVHQLLANYQMENEGGGGYLRIMQFHPARRRVVVQTYSPYLDRFKTDPGNDFELAY